ncbi:MAG: HIT domain-containing protein [Pseudomonadota bacterium]
MERLWAPWRMGYVQSDKDAKEAKGCLFCDLPAQGEKEFQNNLILSCGEKAFVILNRYPYNNAHLMVAPRAHVPDPADLSDEDYRVLTELLRRVSTAMRQVLKPHGINLGMNLGLTAGAGIADHCHYHLVPRWEGDTNFMVVIGGTRVISVGLTETYDQLFPAMGDLCQKTEEDIL